MIFPVELHFYCVFSLSLLVLPSAHHLIAYSLCSRCPDLSCSVLLQWHFFYPLRPAPVTTVVGTFLAITRQICHTSSRTKSFASVISGTSKATLSPGLFCFDWSSFSLFPYFGWGRFLARLFLLQWKLLPRRMHGTKRQNARMITMRVPESCGRGRKDNLMHRMRGSWFAHKYSVLEYAWSSTPQAQK